MTSSKYTELPSISLTAIDYCGLRRRESSEVLNMMKAATELGFFYLKVDNQLNLDAMYELAEKVFQMPIEDKLKYEMDGENGVYFGYKPIGTTVTNKSGASDSFEFWNISKDEFLVHDGKMFPRIILEASDIVKDFMIKSHEIVSVILEIFSINLGLDSKVLPGLHRLMQHSGDQIRLTKSTMHPSETLHPSDISLGAHTDFGSVTILFNRLYGLQVLSPEKKWLFVVPPSPGHVIVNLGDAMVKLSGHRLKSNTHRVVTAPGLKVATDRYSVVYFSRPENNVLMRNLLDDKESEDGSVDHLTAQEWIARRVKGMLVANYTDESNYDMNMGRIGTEVKCD